MDLDLHARLENGEVVSFERLESRSPTGSVQLLSDLRDAPGTEVLLVSARILLPWQFMPLVRTTWDR